MKSSLVIGQLIVLVLLVCPSVSSAAEPIGRTFDIWEYRVDGNSVLDNRAVEETLYPFLGPQLDLNTVE
jgi:hypothetical protein